MSQFSHRVIGARAIVKMDGQEEATVGGIILPDKNKEPVHQGTVVAVGAGARLDSGAIIPMEVQIGDRVIISPMAGAPLEVDGDDAKYLIINEGHILAIVN